MKIKRTHYIVLFFLLVFTRLNAQYDFSADLTRGCDSLEVNFSFIPTVVDDSVNYIIWDLGNGIDTTFDAAEILHAKYTSGKYPISVYINSLDYDPVQVKIDYIKIYRTISAQFTTKDTASVSPMSVYFDHTDQPLELFGEYTFRWNFDDGNILTGIDSSEIIHTYLSGGVYDATLIVSDTFGCADTVTHPVTVMSPLLPDIIADITEGCDTLKIKFSVINIDTASITSISWDFGNSTTSSLKNPDTVTYFSSAPITTFDINVIIDDDTIVKTDYITVYRSVNAEFSCVDTLTSTQDVNLVCFNLDDQYIPSSVYSYSWQFEGIGPTDDERPLVTYPAITEPDTVSASLTITDETHGCVDSSLQSLIILPDIFVPNVFTPNDDCCNNLFQIHGLLPMQIKIYDRYGLLIFAAEGTELIWNGETANGIEVESGVYFYILKSLVADPTGKYNKTGFIHLFKEK